MNQIQSKGKADHSQRAKGWFLTYPKCEVTPQACLAYLQEKLNITEYVIAQEDHADGTKHLHVFLKTEKKISFKHDKFDLPEHHGNYQIAKSWAAVKKYVQKGGVFIASIDVDSAATKRGKKNLALLKMDPKVALEEGLIGVFQLKSLVQAQYLYQSLQQPYEHSDVRGVWYYGKPGTGKSRRAREEYPDAYIKAQNKWFDGYVGQKQIILDDFDQGGVCLGHYLKIWADRYACSGEVKGGTVSLVHEVLIITSNYRPEDLFTDLEICAAISRRFKLIGF